AAADGPAPARSRARLHSSGRSRVSVAASQSWPRTGGVGVNEPETATVDINGFPTRVWRKGRGPVIGFLAGYRGRPGWVPVLDRLAESRSVVAPSLPGFPGGDRGHSVLDSHLDWVLAARTLIDKAGLAGADLVGSSVGGAFAAELAAIWPEKVKRLALTGPVCV